YGTGSASASIRKCRKAIGDQADGETWTTRSFPDFFNTVFSWSSGRSPSSPKFNDFFNKLIDEYEQGHPGVTIDWKDYPYDAIQAKLLALSGFFGGFPRSHRHSRSTLWKRL
ncbi:hypothetical protein BN871_LI_00010, partial [Paenibacillus sp. P22]